ncbi:AAA family ATPase [Dietzia sp. 179-F 9C3 NHS]|uniref:AAA family ATPase n=1 Tax=Dietzia sp. 179-F 9C3 NHS TaxID=3374295 RepID=UPI003879E8D4
MLLFGFGFIPEEDEFDDEELDSTYINMVTATGLRVWGKASSPTSRQEVGSSDSQSRLDALASIAREIEEQCAPGEVPPHVTLGVVNVDDELAAGPKPAQGLARAFADAVHAEKTMRADPATFLDMLVQLTPDLARAVRDAYIPRTLAGRSDVEIIRTVAETGQPIALGGPPGAGKTTLCREALGDKLIIVPCSSATTWPDLVGLHQPVSGPEGPFKWVDGPLWQAMEQGRPLLLDDAGALHQGVQTALHPALDARRSIDVIDRPGTQHLRAADGFSLLLTFNPGNGPGLSEPVRNRMALIVDVPTDFATATQLEVPPAVVDVAEALQRRADADRADGMDRWVPSLRELLAARDLAAVVDVEFAAEALVSKAPTLADREETIEMFRRRLGEQFASGGAMTSGAAHRTAPSTW